MDGLVLEPNALAAVTMTDKNVVVAAGPGAGKTELLAQRADFLLRTGTAPYPRRILAISFKVDAARNLRDRVRKRSGAQYAARFDSFTFHAFAKRLIDNYRPALQGINQLQPDYRIDYDTRIQGEQIRFDDLIPLALEILESNSYAQAALRQTYSHVFLDEFQDATRNQYKLVSTAFLDTDAHLTAVGDVKQRIMTWAGALNGVMKKFSDEFDAAALPLYQNFRSAPRLRRMQNRMILDMDPSAASPEEDLVGDDGVIQVAHFDTQEDEADFVADLLVEWLDEGVPPSEIAVLVRQLSKAATEDLADRLRGRGIALRDEHETQNLATEPAAQLIFNFMWVVAADRRPDAYAELFRVASRFSANDEADLRFDSRLKRFLRDARVVVRSDAFATSDIAPWRDLISEFLEVVSRPTLVSLSPDYRQGARLDEAIGLAVAAIEAELAVDGDAVSALNRLSDLDAVRVLTIHKCKGLEFEKVILVGVEEEFFWGNAIFSEFFVAISRAKKHLVLTSADFRPKPETFVKVWNEDRTPFTALLAYADEDDDE